MIRGDSLQVIVSLARREGLAGKVQMIYLDPPYGIKFASNFQPEIGRRDVNDRETDLTREPEMGKAYRDTWKTASKTEACHHRTCGAVTFRWHPWKQPCLLKARSAFSQR